MADLNITAAGGNDVEVAGGVEAGEIGGAGEVAALEGKSAEEIARERGHDGTAGIIAKLANQTKGADEKLDSLLNAAANGQAERVRQILTAGGDINQQNGDGETALMRAAANGQAVSSESTSFANRKDVNGDYEVLHPAFT